MGLVVTENSSKQNLGRKKKKKWKKEKETKKKIKVSPLCLGDLKIEMVQRRAIGWTTNDYSPYSSVTQNQRRGMMVVTGPEG